MRPFVAAVFLGVWVAALAAEQAAVPASPPVSQTAAERDVAGLTALQRICTACHGLEQTIQGLRARAAWDATFDRMAQHGATGTDEEWARALAYVIRYYSILEINRAVAADIQLFFDEDEKTARAILDYRAANGAFKTADDVKQVPGLDPQKVESRRTRLVF